MQYGFEVKSFHFIPININLAKKLNYLILAEIQTAHIKPNEIVVFVNKKEKQFTQVIFGSYLTRDAYFSDHIFYFESCEIGLKIFNT